MHCAGVNDPVLFLYLEMSESCGGPVEVLGECLMSEEVRKLIVCINN